jgi:predicted nucleic acid-binding protein
MLYLDTGCLVKLYYPEPETARAAAKTAGRRIVFNPLHNLEFTSAMRLKVFRREATDDQVQATLRLVEQDISAGKLIIIDNINGTTLKTAIELANQHSAETGCRSLDTLHCSLAWHLGIEGFLSTDSRQHALARLIHLPLLDL